MSGSIPILLILLWFGVKYSFVVIFIPLPSFRVYKVCITPLPYVVFPIKIQLSTSSLSIPAKISDALKKQIQIKML